MAKLILLYQIYMIGSNLKKKYKTIIQLAKRLSKPNQWNITEKRVNQTVQCDETRVRARGNHTDYQRPCNTF